MTQRFTKIDRPAIRTIGEAAAKALQAVAEQYGLTITEGGHRFSNGQTGQLNFSLALPSADGEAQTAQEIAFRRNAVLWGLKPSDLGEVITYNGNEFRITGANPKKPKYAILAVRLSDNKEYGLTHQGVAQALELKRLRSKAA